MPEVVDRKAVKRVFVLRCHPRILGRRLKAKGWSRRKVRENLLAEILDVCLVSSVNYYGRQRVTQLDTSRISLKRNVALAKRIANGFLAKRQVKLDWIRQLEIEGLLRNHIK